MLHYHRSSFERIPILKLAGNTAYSFTASRTSAFNLYNQLFVVSISLSDLTSTWCHLLIKDHLLKVSELYEFRSSYFTQPSPQPQHTFYCIRWLRQ